MVVLVAVPVVAVVDVVTAHCVCSPACTRDPLNPSNEVGCTTNGPSGDEHPTATAEPALPAPANALASTLCSDGNSPLMVMVPGND